jgi:hypothetical protein
MYLKISEVFLLDTALASRRGLTDEDTVPVFERGYNGGRVLTLDDDPSKYDDTPPRRYGRLYLSASEQICVIPDTWSDDDAIQAAGHDHSRYYGGGAA